MPVIGFHNSHEQIHPAQLRDDVRPAGFAWSSLGATLATTSLPCGAGNSPGERCDPWPGKPVRDARLRECVDVSRALPAVVV